MEPEGFVKQMSEFKCGVKGQVSDSRGHPSLLSRSSHSFPLELGPLNPARCLGTALAVSSPVSTAEPQ